MRQNEGSTTPTSRNSGDDLGWYVRVNGKKVFGPFPRQRCDAFVNARRTRTGTKTEVRRGSKGVWHTVKHTIDAPPPITKRGSAYKIWEAKKTAKNVDNTTTAEDATRMSESMKRRLSRVNRVRQERVENERIARETENRRVATERRAGAGFLAKLYDVPEQNILPKRMSMSDFW